MSRGKIYFPIVGTIREDPKDQRLDPEDRFIPGRAIHKRPWNIRHRRYPTTVYLELNNWFHEKNIRTGSRFSTLLRQSFEGQPFFSCSIDFTSFHLSTLRSESLNH